MTHKITDLACHDGWLSKNVIFDQLESKVARSWAAPARAAGIPFPASITAQIMLLFPSPSAQLGEAPFRAGALALASVGLNHKGTILTVFSKFFGFTSFLIMHSLYSL